MYTPHADANVCLTLASQASKLEGRVAADGLVGIVVSGNRAAMVEVCTDVSHCGYHY